MNLGWNYPYHILLLVFYYFFCDLHDFPEQATYSHILSFDNNRRTRTKLSSNVTYYISWFCYPISRSSSEVKKKFQQRMFTIIDFGMICLLKPTIDRDHCEFSKFFSFTVSVGNYYYFFWYKQLSFFIPTFDIWGAFPPSVIVTKITYGFPSFQPRFHVFWCKLSINLQRYMYVKSEPFIYSGHNSQFLI